MLLSRSDRSRVQSRHEEWIVSERYGWAVGSHGPKSSKGEACDVVPLCLRDPDFELDREVGCGRIDGVGFGELDERVLWVGGVRGRWERKDGQGIRGSEEKREWPQAWKM